MKVLVVANRTASTPRLLEEVARRAKAQPTEFTLLIPNVRETADWTHETAVELLSRAARKPVDSLLGVAVHDAIRDGDFDEIIISTHPKHRSKWRRRDLVHRVEQLGVPVTPIRETFDDGSRRLGVNLAPSVCCSTRELHRRR